MGKISAFFDLFRKGVAVANPEAWKTGGMAFAPVLVAFLVSLDSLLDQFGIDIHMDTQTATLVAGGVLAIYHWVLTFITSDKVGVLPAKEVPPVDPPDSSGGFIDPLNPDGRG